ncbi:hypothetical protein AG0111_0g3470 [Alternaria gaisen]|uniref:Uncharacterized protein n=1 Tax=Alternaria gaisen TaxID=167740 RepID=A0ACB6FV74_9PLEO|nr:hypothetical protein AG0111_0g3470 [Alternaria gaisen]
MMTTSYPHNGGIPSSQRTPLVRLSRTQRQQQATLARAAEPARQTKRPRRPTVVPSAGRDTTSDPVKQDDARPRRLSESDFIRYGSGADSRGEDFYDRGPPRITSDFQTEHRSTEKVNYSENSIGALGTSQRTPEPRLSRKQPPVDTRRELLSGLTPFTRWRLKRDEIKSDPNQGLQQGQDMQFNLLPEADLNASRPLYGNHVKAVFHDKPPPVTEHRRTERESPAPNMNSDPTLAPPGIINPAMMQQQRTAQRAFMQQQQAELAERQQHQQHQQALRQQAHQAQLGQMQAQQKAIALQHAQPQSSNHSQAGNQESNPERLSQNLQSRQQEAQRQYAMRLQQQQQLGNRAENSSIVYTSSTTRNNKRRRPVSDSLFHRPDDKSSKMTSKQSFGSAHNFSLENLKYTISEDHTRDDFKRRKAQFGALGQHNSQQAQQPKHIYNDPSPSDDVTSADEDLLISSKEDGGRSAGSGGFLWITGKNPDDFKTKHVMQTVRQRAMSSYLQGARSQASNKSRFEKEFEPRGPSTQEDFQHWKEQMRARDTPAGEKEQRDASSRDRHHLDHNIRREPFQRIVYST